MRSQLLVEVVLQLEGAAALFGLGGVEGPIRAALLEGDDDRGRVGDRPPVELQDRKGLLGAAAEPQAIAMWTPGIGERRT